MERTVLIYGLVLLVSAALAEVSTSRQKLNLQEEQLEQLLDALEAISVSRRGNIGGFVPRLGREVLEEEKRSHGGGAFIPRLGRESGEDVVNLAKWLQDPEFAEEFLYQRSPPFAPRLGKRMIPFAPRLGRDGHHS